MTDLEPPDTRWYVPAGWSANGVERLGSAAHPEVVRVDGEGSVPLTEQEQEKLTRQIFEADALLLAAEGLFVLAAGGEIDSGLVLLTIAGGPDPDTVHARLVDRYGPAVSIEWVGSSMHHRTRTPFGSWQTGTSRLTVFYGLDHNGDRLVDASIIEETHERVVVELIRSEYLGIKTLVGGFERHQLDLALSAPLNGRSVIDAADDAPRPERPPRCSAGDR